jgi:hypothetical protein
MIANSFAKVILWLNAEVCGLFLSEDALLSTQGGSVKGTVWHFCVVTAVDILMRSAQTV